LEYFLLPLCFPWRETGHAFFIQVALQTQLEFAYKNVTNNPDITASAITFYNIFDSAKENIKTLGVDYFPDQEHEPPYQ
jgi:hypothetical protein